MVLDLEVLLCYPLLYKAPLGQSPSMLDEIEVWGVGGRSRYVNFALRQALRLLAAVCTLTLYFKMQALRSIQRVF